MTIAEAAQTARTAAAQPAEVEIVLNATAGAEDKEAARARLAELFAAAGVAARVVLARSGAEIEEFARRAAEGPATKIVAGGGDGTISAVAARLVGTQKALGVLPLGTLNHFAKDLHIPLDMDAAAQTIITGHTARVDVGEVNGRIFLNNSSIGLYPRIVRQREKQERQGHARWLAFAWALVVGFKRFPFLKVHLSADGRELYRQTPFVFVGNNEYEMDSFNVGARACLDGGKLSLHVTHKAARLRLVGLALRALFGRLRAARDFDSVCAREVWIETRRARLSVAADGEITVMRTPLHYRVRPGALTVIVPQNRQE
ncbi:MAG TPA: diacylglycerol kinase family protein [Pyrinomonadaceae bacterium]